MKFNKIAKSATRWLVVFALMAAILCMFVACSEEKPATPPEVYSTESIYEESAYKGDVLNVVSETLILNSDGTYEVVEHTSIAHPTAVKIVTFWTYKIKGTYTVKSTDAEAKTKVISLSAATEVSKNMNGSMTLSSEDEGLLEYDLAAAREVTVSTETFKYVA